jgi:hypothetical protein
MGLFVFLCALCVLSRPVLRLRISAFGFRPSDFFLATVVLALAVPLPASAQLGKGFMILLNRGLQVEGLITSDNYFHPDTFSNANYTAVNFGFNSSGNLGPISVFIGDPPGSLWARWASDSNNMPTQGFNGNGTSRTNEIPYTNQLVTLQLGDEWDLNNDTTRSNLVNWFVAARTNWPNTILHHNNWGGQIGDSQLADFLTRAQPDMISFDTYPWSAPEHRGAHLGAGQFASQWFSQQPAPGS